MFVNIPTQVTVNRVTKENQTRQVRIIFNPWTNILIKYLSFCFIAIGLLLQDLNFVRKEIKVLRTNVSEIQVSLKRRRVDFLAGSSKYSRKILILSVIVAEQC